MHPSSATIRNARIIGLCLLGMLSGCIQDAGSTTGAGTGGNAGSTGGAGGRGGSTDTAGGVESGGFGGASGSSSGGASTGGGGASSGAGGTVETDSGTAPGDERGVSNRDASSDAKGDASGKNTCPSKVTNYRLPGFSVQDFCDAYEFFCKYDPPGAMSAYCTKTVGPLFHDRADCEMQYTKASDLGKACRAGQLCQNAPRGLIVNACSHAAGYCDPACGQ